MCMEKCKLVVLRAMSLFCVVVASAGQFSCAPQSHFIDTHTKRDEVGNYVIHWETLPVMEGKVEIFVSDNPNHFPTSPMMTETISNQMAVYDASNDISRKFFLLVFNQKQTAITAARLPYTDSSINIRDIGGYSTAGGQAMKWGMIARSGALQGMTSRDSALIENFRFKSRLILSEAVDRTELHGELPRVSSRLIPTTVDHNFPADLLHILNSKVTPEMVRERQVDYLTELAYNNKSQYSKALHFLLDPNNYPVLISDGLGKDRVGFLVMLIQCILDVSHNDVIREYLESNQVLSAARLIPVGYMYSAEVQESLTEYCRCRESDLSTIIGILTRQHGSVSKYVEDVLNFSPAEQIRLKKILLFDGNISPSPKN